VQNRKGLTVSAILPLVIIIAVLIVMTLQILGIIDIRLGNVDFGGLSPARNLTGMWEGRATWHDNIGSPVCFFEGTFRFDLKQSGNQLQGSWWMTQTKLTEMTEGACGSALGTEIPMGELSGTVGGSRAQFSASLSGMEFSSTFTTDQLKGTFVLNKEFGLTGEFSAFRKS